MRHDELHVGRGNLDLLEAVFDAADGVGDMREAPAVKDGFLHTGHAAETEFLAHLADFAEKTEIQN